MITTLFGTSPKKPNEPIFPNNNRVQKLQAGTPVSIYEWSRRMLGGRSLIRNGRQRRVLSKHIQRSNSLTQNDSSSNSFLPNYTYASILSLSFCFFQPKTVFISAALSFLVINVIFPYIHTQFNGYFRKGTSNHGPTFREKCYYYLDYWISTNPYAKALVLLALTWALILTSGTIISWMANEPWLESLWAAALGSGLDWGFVNSTNPTLRFVAVCTNVGGLVLTALLLSIISDAVQTKYDSLRKGESVVTEVRHTLMIGWSVKALSVMTQLAKSGASIGTSGASIGTNAGSVHNVIVCLTDQREKEDMENDIAQHDFNFANVGTRVVCRSGSPLAYHELRKVSFNQARSIIILGDDDNDAETSDARSLQILLSIVAALEREKVNFLDKRAVANSDEDDRVVTPVVDITAPRPDRIVIEVMDTENAGIMKSVCPELVEPVLAHDLVGRLLLQAARNPLVADVWQELLGFDGCEIYSGQWGILRGLSFGEVLLCFESAIPLGVKKNTGDLMLNPDDSYVIGEGDEIVVLAEDEESYWASISHSLIRERVPDDNSPGGLRFVDICPGGMKAISTFATVWAKNPSLGIAKFGSRDIFGQDVERILFCGWRFDMGNLLQVFSAVAPPGSEFWILCEMRVEDRQSELRLRGWENNNRVKVVHRLGSCRRNVLARMPLESFTSVIVGTADSSETKGAESTKMTGEMASPNGKSEVAGGPDARVITVVMMIQDIVSRRNVDAKEGITSGRGASSYDYFDDSDAPKKKEPDESALRTRGTSMGLARARSQKFIGAKNTRECTAPRGVIVGEIVDSRSRAMLSMVNSIDAVVASSELISKAVAMVSEDSSVNRVLNSLFDPYDSEITLEGVERYIALAENERVSFFEMMARGRQLGTIVMGYLEREIVSSDTDQPSTIRYTEVKLNPSNKDVRRGWHPDDLLIVLTPGTSETSLGGDGPADFLADIEEVKSLDMTREFSWGDGPKSSSAKRSKVRFGDD